jgi:hypothetical protein
MNEVFPLMEKIPGYYEVSTVICGEFFAQQRNNVSILNRRFSGIK